MRLSLRKGAWGVSTPQVFAGNRGKWATQPQILRDNRKRNRRSLHYATPDFLSRLVALANFMRLSLRKAATAAISSAAWQEIRVRSGRDDNSVASPAVIRLTGIEAISCDRIVIPRGCDFIDFLLGFGGRKALKSVGQQASSGSFDCAPKTLC